MICLLIFLVFVELSIPSRLTKLKVLDCEKTTIFGKNYNRSKPDLYIVMLLMKGETYDYKQGYQGKWRDGGDSFLSGFNINFLLYRFSYKCNVPSSELLLDILLNNTLNDGRHFKIIGVIADVSKRELNDLANILSFSSTPVISFSPLADPSIQYKQLNYHFYDNIFFFPIIQQFEKNFLIGFVKRFDIRFITFLREVQNDNSADEFQAISAYLQKHDVCINMHSVKDADFLRSSEIETLLRKTTFKVFLLQLNDFDFFKNLIDTFSKYNITKRLIIVLDKGRRFYSDYIKESVYKACASNIDFTVISERAYFWNDDFYLDNSIKAFVKMTEHAMKKSKINTGFSGELRRANTLFTKNSAIPIIPFLELETPVYLIIVVYLANVNGSLAKKGVFYGLNQYEVSSKWKCGKCEKIADIQPVCERTCSAGQYAIFFSAKCCWKCFTCPPGYVKPIKGPQQCSKCMYHSIPNRNFSRCLQFSYSYYSIKNRRKIAALTLSVSGIIYTSSFLVIFLWYKNTPLVKSSNLKLSVFQITLHLIMNIQIMMAILQQVQFVCVLHACIWSYLLKIIMSVCIIKTNQLITIFNSMSKIQRNICVRMKEVFFPIVFFTIDIFITVTFLTESKIVHSIVEIKESMMKYKMCDTGTYFYIERTSLIILSVFCSVQAFQARHLPTNFHETYYIFLGMFTTLVILLLSIPLRANFRMDGQNIFVQSCTMFCINMVLITINYGYKIFIILFQKHRNRRETFQKEILESIKRDIIQRTRPTDSKI